MLNKICIFYTYIIIFAIWDEKNVLNIQNSIQLNVGV